MLCAACGTENRTGSRFCDNCGTPLAATCPSCGEPNRSDARFCASCGAAIHAEAATVTHAPSSPSAERRLVSVLFADLVGFTTFAEDRDPESVRELLSRYFEAATQVVERHGGTVEKFIGDAVMAVWGTPVAHEDDAERAVRAALEIVDAVRALQPDLQARAGVLTGEAAVTLNAQNQGMVAGDLVNTASRLQGVAEAGSVLVGETTMRAASRAVVFEPIGEHSVRGKTTPVPAWQALRVVAARGGQGRTDALEPPFVGRDEELRELKEVLHAVGRERRPRLVSITGPGGIGKSRLVWELEKYVDGVAERIYWHRGRSPSYGEGITFWALGEMVRRRAQLTEDADEEATRHQIAAALEQYVDDPNERERIGPALLSLLGVEDAPPGGRDAVFPAWRLFFERVAERGTTVLVFEDLQWADTGLLDFIDHLLDWTRGLPIMVVTLARPELFDRRPDWGAGHRKLTALALEPLKDADVRVLLDGLVPGLPDDAVAAIVGRAEGVPLYAVETVRGLLADGRIERRDDVYVPTGDLSSITIPHSLRSLIASRLDALNAEDRAVLQAASVLGQVFAPGTLAAVTGVEESALEQQLHGLARRELLEIENDPRSPERGQYKFMQSVIREVAYGTLGRRDRRARHLAAARHFEALGDDELAGALANHYLAAREASDAGEEADAVAAQARLALGAAAERAAALGAHDQAIAYLDQALTVATSPTDRAPLLDRAAASAAAASRDAERYALEAIDAYAAAGDRVAVAAATARLGKALIDNGAVTRAADVLDAALPEAEELGDEVVLAVTLVNRARAHMRSGEGEPAVAKADRALAIAERLNLEPVVAEGFVNKGSALGMLGRRREAIALQEAALEIAVRLDDRGFEMRVRNNLAAAYGEDDPERSTRMLIEIRELARSVGDRSMYNWITGTAGVTAHLTGAPWDDHLALMREAFESATLASDRLRLRTLIGVLETARGERVDEFEREATELFGSSTDVDDRFAFGIAMGHVAMARHQYDVAYQETMRIAELTSQNPEIALRLALQAAVMLRDPQRLRPVVDAIEAAPTSGMYSQAERLGAQAARLGLEGRRAEAVAAYREQRAILTKLGQHYAAAVSVIQAARLLPDEPEVRAWADEARRLFMDLGAVTPLAHLDVAVSDGQASGTHARASAEVVADVIDR